MSYLPSSFDSDVEDWDEMPFVDKMVHHCKQQPLVPLGTLATTGAVILAVLNVKNGNKRKAQIWFRWRVGLQGFTLLALVAGSYLYGSNKKERESQEEQLRKKAKMREELWIQELERRDQETKSRRQKAEFARQKAKDMELETSKLQQELKELEERLKK
ncbi:unnamed protein product [Kluyveromyces dobzhanskii CBS 2104]|uniref:Respiratory supercomplex factor 1, mitochondrial n=1 Tax=Kluyveromyces dobzhanskii CBS 2104 TaxID=1427455 RepID=A0A0A8KZB1_9SACH|nr:unnamed protein product [Kluyveromyces dobzhanskii CBS 2104]